QRGQRSKQPVHAGISGNNIRGGTRLPKAKPSHLHPHRWRERQNIRRRKGPRAFRLRAAAIPAGKRRPTIWRQPSRRPVPDGGTRTASQPSFRLLEASVKTSPSSRGEGLELHESMEPQSLAQPLRPGPLGKHIHSTKEPDLRETMSGSPGPGEYSFRQLLDPGNPPYGRILSKSRGCDRPKNP